MFIQIDKLYRLTSAEGDLSLDDCNNINHELVMMSPVDIPEHQISNVIDYLCNVLLWGSALHSHREKLDIFCEQLQKRQS